MVASGQCAGRVRPSLTPQQHQTHFLEHTLPGELPPHSWGLPPLSGSPAVPGTVPGLLGCLPLPSAPPSPPGSPAPPQVAAQSPPPTQPRERMAGTEFNRHHQQPPGKLGKVDTLIPVTVSGE